MTPALILAASLICTDVRVADGDTLTCSGTRVRLYAIDTPELRDCPFGRRFQCASEPGAQAAKSRLYTLTRGRVTCKPAGNQHDRYGRTIARCFSNGSDLGAQLLREGMACRWSKYDRARVYVGIGRDCGERR